MALQGFLEKLFTRNYFFIILHIILLSSVITFSSIYAADISGRVTDSNGNPIENICVNANTGTCWDNWVGGTQTDSNGNYTITNLSDNTNYYISTDVSCGGNNSSYFIDELYNDLGPQDDCADAAPVASGQTEINFVLEAGGNISGTFTSDNAAITGVDNLGVTVFSGTCSDLQWVGYGAVDPNNGTFTTGGVPAGNYYLQAETAGTPYIQEYWASPSSVWDCDDAQLVQVTAGNTTTNTDFQLEKGATISGTLADSQGNAITNENSLGVDIYDTPPCDSPSGPVAYAPIDPSTGTYTTNALAPGDYYLQVAPGDSSYINEYWAEQASVRSCDDAEAITVTGAETISGKDFQLEKGGSVSGVLYDSATNNPIDGSVENIEIWLQKGTDPCNTQGAGGAFLNPDGSYTINGIEAGTYYVQIAPFSSNYIFEYWAQSESVRDCADAETVTVTVDQDTGGVNFQLEKGGSVSGMLYDSATNNPIDGSVENIEIWVQKGTDPCNTQWAGGAFLNPDGSYTINGIEAGTYYIQTSPFNTNYISEFWAQSESVEDCADAETVTVTADQNTSGIDFQLNLGSTVSGTVYEDDGTTAITDSDLQIVAFTGTNPCDLQYFKEVQVNSDGTYSIPGLSPGNYYLQTNSGTSFYIPEYWASNASVVECSSAEVITVSADTPTENINFQLSEGGSMSGTVFQANGTDPLTGTEICVDIYKTNPCNTGDWERIGGNCINQNSGIYHISGVPAGDYYVYTNTFNSEYQQEWWTSSGSDPDCTNATPVHIEASQDTQGVNFQLDFGNTVSGNLIDEATGANITNHPGMQVKLYAGDPCGSQQYLNSVEVAPDGTFSIAGIADGSFYLRTDTANEYLNEWYTGSGSDPDCSNAVLVSVSDNQVLTDVNFYLSKGARISGHVFSSDGTTSVDTQGREMEIEIFQGHPCTTPTFIDSASISEADGSYQTPALADGTYFLRIREKDTLEKDELYQREWWAEPESSPDCGSAQPIVIINGVDLSDKDFQVDLKKKPFPWSLFLPAIIGH